MIRSQSPILRAFQHRNYRLFFLGQFIAINGLWMTMAALSWLTYRLTRDPVSLGVMVFFKQVPTFLITPFGGVLVDRVSRRGVIQITQRLDAVFMTALGFLTITDRVSLWQVYATCVLLGITKAFELPARQALVRDIVDKPEHLSNAIALNSTLFQSARLIGPMFAGTLIIPLIGEGPCFLLHAVFCLTASLCFAHLRPRPMQLPEVRPTVFRQLHEGFSYAFGFPPVRDLLLIVILSTVFGHAFNTLLPVFAEDILGGDSGTYGLLLASTGLGALVSSLYLASRKSALGLGRIIYRSVLLFGVSLFLFSLTRSLAAAMLLLVCAGMAGIQIMVGTNTIIQTLVDDRLRGRVMSVMGMVFMGAMPLGSLLYGKLAELHSAPQAIQVGASVCMVTGLLFRFRLPALQRIVRPLYEKRGLIPAEVYPVFSRIF